MPHIADSDKPFGNLFDRLNGAGASGPRAMAYAAQAGEVDSRKILQDAAQLAIQVEMTTIPPYLTALYSIKDPASEAYQTLRSVVMEEMFHVNQAANLLVAIGGRPRLTGAAVPVYPCYLPHANPESTPFIGLSRASIDVFQNTFTAIERPAPPHAAPQGSEYDTIAQLYEALIDGLERYQGVTPLFQAAPGMRQRTTIYLGKFGGDPVEVTSLASAKLGVQQIVQQGEGSIPDVEPMIPLSPWGTYNYYGKRTDGTYGPISGTPYEMSHFKKFRTVALDTANFPATWPILANPQRSDLSNPVALKFAELFDIAYSAMLDALEQSFVDPGQGAPDAFLSRALPLMHSVMPRLARQLMQTPVHSNGDGNVGPNAAPTYVYEPGANLGKLGDYLEQAHDVVQGTVADRAERDAVAQTLTGIQAELVRLEAASSMHSVN
ncbi:ferritin-like domain-containing protein [Paraburkholderia bannensis]|uniref:ferritin-like domain-containing protein n=1 Tax=Paraburkholderia bannensis TaxID=765414 RepID=UPI002AB67F48|nr:ferritin-like protein [Paraburkholderia bannensis]